MTISHICFFRVRYTNIDFVTRLNYLGVMLDNRMTLKPMYDMMKNKIDR